jgi:hypothetical protein
MVGGLGRGTLLNVLIIALLGLAPMSDSSVRTLADSRRAGAGTASVCVQGLRGGGESGGGAAGEVLAVRKRSSSRTRIVKRGRTRTCLRGSVPNGCAADEGLRPLRRPRLASWGGADKFSAPDWSDEGLCVDGGAPSCATAVSADLGEDPREESSACTAQTVAPGGATHDVTLPRPATTPPPAAAPRGAETSDHLQLQLAEDSAQAAYSLPGTGARRRCRAGAATARAALAALVDSIEREMQGVLRARARAHAVPRTRRLVPSQSPPPCDEPPPPPCGARRGALAGKRARGARGVRGKRACVDPRGGAASDIAAIATLLGGVAGGGGGCRSVEDCCGGPWGAGALARQPREAGSGAGAGRRGGDRKLLDQEAHGAEGAAAASDAALARAAPGAGAGAGAGAARGPEGSSLDDSGAVEPLESGAELAGEARMLGGALDLRRLSGCGGGAAAAMPPWLQ